MVDAAGALKLIRQKVITKSIVRENGKVDLVSKQFDSIMDALDPRVSNTKDKQDKHTKLTSSIGT